MGAGQLSRRVRSRLPWVSSTQTAGNDNLQHPIAGQAAAQHLPVMQQLQHWTNHQRQAAEAGPQPSTQRRQVAHLVAVQRADHARVAVNVLNVPLPQVACKGLEARNKWVRG